LVGWFPQQNYHFGKRLLFGFHNFLLSEMRAGRLQRGVRSGVGADELQ
jgi:hypothetical protein